MRFYLGKLFQALGLSLVALGLFIGIREDNLKVELVYGGIGAAIFVAGTVALGKKNQ